MYIDAYKIYRLSLRLALIDKAYMLLITDNYFNTIKQQQGFAIKTTIK